MDRNTGEILPLLFFFFCFKNYIKSITTGKTCKNLIYSLEGNDQQRNDDYRQWVLEGAGTEYFD